jgi:FkbM family methyltransferase
MRPIDLLWKLPFGRRTALNIFKKCDLFDRRVVISLENVAMEIDVSQNLDMQYAYGIYDSDELAFLESNYKQGDWFLDIGANMGFYSLFFAKRHTGMKVLAFEPDPYNADKFKKNILLNSLKNITLCEYALAEENTEMELMLNTGNNRGGNSLVLRQTEFCGEDVCISVACKTLPDALAENGVDRIGILKIDVEGYEYPILKRFFSVAPQELFPRAMIVEAFGENIERVGGSPLQLLVKKGYTLVYHVRNNYFFKWPE